jgi:hypothetical protein
MEVNYFMKSNRPIIPQDLSKEELLAFIGDAAKNWLAHDGLWFQAVEKQHGMDAAIELDRQAWEKFTVIEAERIMKRLEIPPDGGIPALVQALKFRLYAFINVQEIIEVSNSRCVLRMNKCRVQDARGRKGLPDFPCKTVGIVEYSNFAKTIDPRFRTNCIACPPDPHPKEYFCAWEFVLEK